MVHAIEFSEFVEIVRSRVIQRVSFVAMDVAGVVDLNQANVELWFAEEVVTVAFDERRGEIVFSRGAPRLPDYQTLEEWLGMREEWGVMCRFELPESPLRDALYGTTFEEVVATIDDHGVNSVRLTNETVVMELTINANAELGVKFELKRR